MIVCVCGGRDYEGPVAKKLLDEALSGLHELFEFSKLTHGGARGFDTLADQWARANGVPVHPVYANWTEHGKQAGPIRNEEIISVVKPELVVAFPGGAGTADMCERAHARKIFVLEYTWPKFEFVDWRTGK